jgi:DNA-binding SARP family transcriptional activator
MNSEGNARPLVGRLEIEAFGPLVVSRGGQIVGLGPPKQRVLLAILLTRLDAEVPSAELVAALWGERPPVSAGDNLRLYVSRLRQALGADVILGRGRPGYGLNGRAVSADVRRFEVSHAAAQALLRAGDTSTARALLAEVALIRCAEPFAGLPANPVLDLERRRLEEQWLLGCEQRLRIDLDTGRATELIDELAALIRRHPSRERLVGMAVVALHRAGNHRGAVGLFRRTTARLRVEFGVEPLAELIEAYRSIMTT